MKYFIRVLALMTLLMPLAASGDNMPKICKIGDLPFCAGGPEPGRLVWVRDGINADDCTIGGGKGQHYCVRRGDGTFSPAAIASERVCLTASLVSGFDKAYPYVLSRDAMEFTMNTSCTCNQKQGGTACAATMFANSCDSLGADCGGTGRFIASCTCTEPGTVGVCTPSNNNLPKAGDMIEFTLAIAPAAGANLFGISTCLDITY